MVISVDWLNILLVLIIGVGAGTFYFSGLWWTVRRLPQSRRPARWSLVSFLLRALVVLVVFYAASNGHPERLILCLVGFTLARVVLLRRIGLEGDRKKSSTFIGKDVLTRSKG